MDEETQQRLHKFIAEKWKQGECPVCKTNSWDLGNDFVEIAVSEHFGTDISSMGAFYPLLPVFCSNCGYTLLFNAGTAGLFGTHPAESAESTAEGELGQ